MNNSKEKLLDSEEDSQADREKKAGTIIKVSLLVASCWWGFGVYTVVVTQSLAVLASLVDATIDLLAQGTLLICNYLAKDGATDEEIYPLGVSRLEPIGVILCFISYGIGFSVGDHRVDENAFRVLSKRSRHGIYERGFCDVGCRCACQNRGLEDRKARV